MNVTIYGDKGIEVYLLKRWLYNTPFLPVLTASGRGYHLSQKYYPQQFL